MSEVEKIYSENITSIDDQRSAAVYRKTVALRLIQYFLKYRIKKFKGGKQ